MKLPDFADSVSVIICTYNRAEDLKKTLTALFVHRDPRVEIILVDDGSTDNTRDTALEFDLTYIKNNDKGGIARVRNIGLNAARGQYIVYLDDDCLVSENWLYNLLLPFKEDRTLGVAGLITAQNNKNLISRFMLETGYGNSPLPPPETALPGPINTLLQYFSRNLHPVADLKESVHIVDDLSGANCAFPRELLLHIGGYNEEFTTSEDTDISYRLKKNFPGKNLLFTKKAPAAHKHYTSFSTMLKIKYMRARKSAMLINAGEKQVPPLYPGPVLFLAGYLFASFTGGLTPLYTVLVLPHCLYFWWIYRWIRHRKKPDVLLFPYIQLCNEAAAMAGAFLGPPLSRKK